MGQHRKALALSCAGSPPVASGQPRWGIGDRIPQTPCVASHCVRYSFHPQSLTGQPRWGIGDRIPQTPCVASHCVRYSFHPQSLRDSPGGALGTVFPKPLASLRTACAIPFTPSRFATAPVGHWGPYSPNPLRRFAPSLLFCIITIILKKYFWICFLIWMCRDYIRHFWNAGV